VLTSIFIRISEFFSADIRRTKIRRLINDSVMHFRSFSRKRNINTLVTVTVQIFGGGLGVYLRVPVVDISRKSRIDVSQKHRQKFVAEWKHKVAAVDR